MYLSKKIHLKSKKLPGRPAKLKIISLLIGLGIISLLVISYIHAYQFTHFSTASEVRTDPKNLDTLDKIRLLFTGIQNPHQEDQNFPSLKYETLYIDGDKRLESWFVPNDKGKGLILFYHGYAGNKSQMLSRAADLHKLGYATAIIGFRGSGNSEGNYTSIGYEESNDVLNSFNFYKDQFPDLPIILFGTSMGAAAILKALDNPNLDINGIIIEYPFGSLYQSVENRFKVMGFPSFPMAWLLTYFGGFQLDFDAFAHNPEEYAKKVNYPTLHLAGDSDDRVTQQETLTIFRNLKTTQKTLYIFKGAGHENLNENFHGEWVRECKKFLKETIRTQHSKSHSNR